MKKLILIGILSFLFLGLTVNPSIRTIATALEEGYKVRAVSGIYYIYNDCDTLVVNKSFYNAKDWQTISNFYKAWQPAYADLKREIERQVVQSELPVRPKIYMVAKENLLFQAAANNWIGLDSSTVSNFRRSITQFQGEYLRVFRWRLPLESDTSKVIGNSNVHYLVPYECTFDSLLNYLNDENSVPRWTEDPGYE
ncbi:MAG: hypothetical protein V3W20_11110 [Candidatus Neomarinimicrobiota bacterium]